MPVLRLRLAGDLSFKVRVRQIIQRDDRLQVEQGLDGPDPMVLKRGLVLEEMIRRAVQGPITQGAKVDPQQLTRGAARTVHVRNQALVARSDPGCAIRPMILASAQPCCRLLRPSAHS